MTPHVNQLVPSAVPGDATTSHTIEMKRLLNDLGYESEIFAVAVHPDLEREVKLIGELSGPSRPDHFLVYQLSGHSELADWLTGRREQVILNYHNITPHHFFWKYDRSIALSLMAAELQVPQLARTARGAVCDSSFNAQDIGARGISPTVVSPVLVDLDGLDPRGNGRTRDSRGDESSREGTAPRGGRFLFVGTVAPHKAQHDLVAALAVYRRTYDPEARLCFVGRPVSRSYVRSVREFSSALGLADAVDFTGSVTHDELIEHYRSAHVFVSASEHEGFCIPIIEAMRLGVPVVAYRAGAVPATAGGAVVLIDDKSPGALASAMWKVASDQNNRELLERAGRLRAEEFSLDRTRQEMASVMESWIRDGRLPDRVDTRAA